MYTIICYSIIHENVLLLVSAAIRFTGFPFLYTIPCAGQEAPTVPVKRPQWYYPAGEASPILGKCLYHSGDTYCYFNSVG
jgi:hypothetical protein